MLLLPQGGWNWAYFRYTGSSFRDTGHFSNLLYLGMKLGHWPKFQKLAHMMFFYPRGYKLGLFLLYGQWFPRYWRFSKLPYLDMKLGHWSKFQNLHIYSFYTLWVKLSLISLYGQRFPRHRLIFKIAIFGHEMWPLAKVPEVSTNDVLLPQRIEIELIFTLRAAA